jgi:hypothetical protein
MVIKDEPDELDDELDDEALLFVVDINVGKRRIAAVVEFTGIDDTRPEFVAERSAAPPARNAAFAPPTTHKTAINPIQFERIFILVPLLVSIYYTTVTRKRKAKINY